MPEFRVDRDAARRTARRAPGRLPGRAGLLPRALSRRALRAARHRRCRPRTTTRARPRGVLRGLHFQTTPGQAKLMRCGRGRIWDVAVDVRLDSPTYGEWFGIELDDVDARRSSTCPSGSPTASACCSDVADVMYKVSNPYDGADRGRASPGTTPTWPSTGRSTIPIVSARDTDATPARPTSTGRAPSGRPPARSRGHSRRLRGSGAFALASSPVCNGPIGGFRSSGGEGTVATESDHGARRRQPGQDGDG